MGHFFGSYCSIHFLAHDYTFSCTYHWLFNWQEREGGAGKDLQVKGWFLGRDKNKGYYFFLTFKFYYMVVCPLLPCQLNKIIFFFIISCLFPLPNISPRSFVSGHMVWAVCLGYVTKINWPWRPGIRPYRNYANILLIPFYLRPSSAKNGWSIQEKRIWTFE